MPDNEDPSFDEELRRYARADPFQSFDIVVTSGDRYEVTDPLQIAIAGDYVFVANRKGGSKFFRQYQIVAIHVHEPTG